MIEILTAILPVFALIAFGYGAAKGGVISEEGANGIDRFVFYFAIPALLFRTMLNIELGDQAPWRLWGAYYSGIALMWLLVGALSATVLKGAAKAGGSSLGMASTFGNLLLMGIPVSVLHFGEAAILPGALIVAIHAPMNWLFGTVWAESAMAKGRMSPAAMLGQVVLSMAKNPIIIALGAGLGWNLFGPPLHPILARLVELLADSSIAAALFALGLSLATYTIRGNVRALAVVMVLKLGAFPVLMWVLATKVFDLAPAQAHVAILFAALPVGVNAYIFAQRYNGNIGAVSSAIMLSVPASALTLPVVLFLIGG